MTQNATARLVRSRELLRLRTAALVEVQHQLRQEMKRRTRSDARLAAATALHRRLLARARRVTHQILAAQEDERREISRELHDGVVQILAGINVRLAGLKEAAAVAGVGLQHQIAQTQGLVEDSVNIVHRYARELRPALLDDLGLLPALRSHIRRLPDRHGLRVRLTAFPGVEALDSARRTVLFRVAQEALTNVARHAEARSARVRIRALPGAVRLEVHDDGKSFSADRVLASSSLKRLGLLGMRERVEMVGGSFSIKSAPGAGTTIRAEIPLTNARKLKP